MHDVCVLSVRTGFSVCTVCNVCTVCTVCNVRIHCMYCVYVPIYAVCVVYLMCILYVLCVLCVHIYCMYREYNICAYVPVHTTYLRTCVSLVCFHCISIL